MRPYKLVSTCVCKVWWNYPGAQDCIDSEAAFMDFGDTKRVPVCDAHIPLRALVWHESFCYMLPKTRLDPYSSYTSSKVSRGLMDKASASGAEDSRFESWRGRLFFVMSMSPSFFMSIPPSYCGAKGL